MLPVLSRNIKQLLIYSSDFVLFLHSNAKQMPASVSDALKEVFQQEGGMSAEEAEQMFAVLERTGRLQMETWS